MLLVSLMEPALFSSILWSTYVPNIQVSSIVDAVAYHVDVRTAQPFPVALNYTFFLDVKLLYPSLEVGFQDLGCISLERLVGIKT